MIVLLLALSLTAGQCSQPANRPENQLAATSEQATSGEAEALTSQIEALAPLNLAAGEKVRVVATTNIIADVAKVIGGPAIELTSLLPLGADPHSLVPTPQDVAAVTEAHLIFSNGLGLETFMAELIENAGGELKTIALSDGLTTLDIEHLAQEEEQEDDHGHDDSDPHVWMAPANVAVWAGHMATALSALDPTNQALYQQNASAYQTELLTLDAWVESQIETIPAQNRKLVTDHETLGYYANRYGLTLIGTVIPSYSTNAEPSAGELAQLEQAIATAGVPAIFVGATVNPKLAEQVSQDSGIRLVPLYTGSLGGPGSGAETYLDLIRYNTQAIVAALQPGQ